MMTRKNETNDSADAISPAATKLADQIFSAVSEKPECILAAEEEEFEDIPDLAIERPDPRPIQNPDHGSTTSDPAGVEIDGDDYYPPQTSLVSQAMLVTMERKLPPPQLGGEQNMGKLAAYLGAVETTLPFPRWIRVPVDYVAWSACGVGDGSRIPPCIIEQRAREHLAMGQLYPCTGRTNAGGDGVEIFTGQLDYKAALFRTELGEDGVTLLVDLHQVDDVGACQTAYAEIGASFPVSPIDLARWAKEAITTTFKNQRTFAAQLGVDESNVTRLLQVPKAAKILKSVIIDEANISRNSSVRFMKLWEDEVAKSKIRQIIDAMKPDTANRVFRSIFEVLNVKRIGGDSGFAVVGDDEAHLGSVRVGRAGTVVIALEPTAGAVEIPALMSFIEAAFTQLRNSI